MGYSAEEKTELERMAKELLDRYGSDSEEVVLFSFYYQKNKSYQMLWSLYSNFKMRDR